MTQFERLTAYLKSLDTRRPHLIMVKMGTDGQPQWWSNQGMVMGAQAQEIEFSGCTCKDPNDPSPICQIHGIENRVENKPVDNAVHS